MLVSVTAKLEDKGNTALFSECGNYRYLLTRTLRTASSSQSPLRTSCLFIMLNPSTADAETNDPTIRRCVDFATRWEATELRVVNLFALRSTDPQILADRGADDAIGPENDRYISDEANRADLIVQAWGNLGSLHGRSGQVRGLIRQHSSKTWHMGLNLTGEPRHPLYIPKDTGLSAEPI